MEKIIVWSDGKIKLEGLGQAFIHAWLHNEKCVKFCSMIMWLVLQVSACVWNIWDKRPFFIDDSKDKWSWGICFGEYIAS